MSKFLFSKVPGTKVVHSTFNNSNQSLVTLPFGKLIPIICEEVLPGDTLRSASSVVARMQPMLSPVCFITTFLCLIALTGQNGRILLPHQMM